MSKAFKSVLNSATIQAKLFLRLRTKTVAVREGHLDQSDRGTLHLAHLSRRIAKEAIAFLVRPVMEKRPGM